MTEVSTSSDLPFQAEYAKSGRASCKACKTSIEKATLRLAIMVQSHMFDGKSPSWHHFKCFFERARPTAISEIGNIESLRWEDQVKIEKKIQSTLNSKLKSSSAKKDFRLEYSKSGGAKCQICEEKISKGIVRISKKEYNSERAKRYGPYDAWHHISCFSKERENLGFVDSGSTLDGFKTLSKEDQIALKTDLPKIEGKRKIKTEETVSKKIKIDPEMKKEKDEIKKQTKKLFMYRDNLSQLKKKDLDLLLEYNHQGPASGFEKALDRVADIMMFGALNPCPQCKEGQLIFKSTGYSCTGDISEWTKCIYTTKDPQRCHFKVPESLKDLTWLNSYKSNVSLRMISSSAQPSANASENSEPLYKSLKDLKFVLTGQVDVEKLRKIIIRHGGRVLSSVDAKTAAVISDPETCKLETEIILNAKTHNVQVISPELCEKAIGDNIYNYIQKSSLVSWGSDPAIRCRSSKSLSSKGKSEKNIEMSNGTQRLKLKGGGTVDPNSGKENDCHVLKRKDVLYSSVLGAVSIQSRMNSYYKLQVLQHDNKSGTYYVFRSWGRVGTDIGGKKIEKFERSSDAIREFERLYEEKSGNSWKHRESFRKLPGKMYPLEIDYGIPSQVSKPLALSSESKLKEPIQKLIALIFNVECMKKTLIEFEIDLNKMPLGKLSVKQIHSAYKLLSEASVSLDKVSETKIIDTTNRFFTLIPHDFGMNSPPLLDNIDYIKSKIEMLNNMLEIEIAYSLLQSPGEENESDPMDQHYRKLNTDLEVLDSKTEEYKTLEKYVQQTHGSTHTLFSLEIDTILKVRRKGEEEAYRPFKKLPNRHLLWHGSRTTNFAGILSQGLRIAPPEAPVTGYMFGKGIYFADMVSKSANYCCTTKSNNVGLLLLCDVALGNIYERTSAKFIRKLPPGKHSTKGIGKTIPDPRDFTELNGAIVPYGKGITSEKCKTSLLYNEYIVYDKAQVEVKYLFVMKFKYNI